MEDKEKGKKKRENTIIRAFYRFNIIINEIMMHEREKKGRKSSFSPYRLINH